MTIAQRVIVIAIVHVLEEFCNVLYITYNLYPIPYMNRIVLIKEGEYRPSLYADFTETVNQVAIEQIGFYSRHDYTFRLTRNRSTTDPTYPLALAHFNVNVASQVQDPVLFRPVDTESIFTALEKYDYVVFGAITPTHLVVDQTLLIDAIYIARNCDGKLVNALTDQVLQPDTTKVTFVTSFFGVVRMKGVPVYTIILNPTLTHVTDGFDYRHKQSNTLYSIVSDHDGTIKNTVFAPSIIGAELFGDTLLATHDSFVLSFFSSPSVLRDQKDDNLLANMSYTIDTNLTYTIDRQSIIVETPHVEAGNVTVNYFSITFHCGMFFDIASTTERPTFRYLVISP